MTQAERGEEGGEGLQGTGAAPGIGVGPAFLLPQIEIPAGREAPLWPGEKATEQEKLRLALAAADSELAAEVIRLRDEGKEEPAGIFEAQQLMLVDPAFGGRALALIGEQALRATEAVAAAAAEAAELLTGTGDPYLQARAADIWDLALRLRRLLGGPEEQQPIPAGALIIAQDLTPSQTAHLQTPVGIALAAGGPTAHAVIIARTLGIPMVIGLGAAILAIPSGTMLRLNGTTGTVEPLPADHMLSATATATPSRPADAQDPALPAITLDGHPLPLKANVGSAVEAERARTLGAEGIGLLRSEFLFLDRATPPEVDEQIRAYRETAAPFIGLPVTIRLLDSGGDKPLPYLPMPREANPFLGTRGIRLLLAHERLLRVQLQAILRSFAGATVRILIPMITDVVEVQALRTILAEEQAALRAQRLPQAEPQLGAMIEVPAAALLAETLAREVEFFSIGTNDLTMYTLARDRSGEGSATHYRHEHPAVLQLIAQVVSAAHQAGRPVALCGEMAGEPALTPLLIGLDIDELSMAGPLLPAVRAAIRDIRQDEARALAARALAAGSADEVRELLSAGTP